MEEKNQKPKQRKRKIFAFIIFPLLIIIGAVILYFYLRLTRRPISAPMTPLSMEEFMQLLQRSRVQFGSST